MNKHKYPECYHKKTNSKNYFEGWYFKQVSKDGLHTISLIPGVSFHANESHCFIQCLYYHNINGLEAYNLDFPISSFHAIDSPFEITIQKNSFHKKGLFLHLDTPNFSLHGNLVFEQISPLQTSILQPNIMGVFSYIPYMECNHAILSMNHTLHGSLTLNGKLIDFEGGKGYVEKDWGRSFPKKYIWIQSNHFPDSQVSLFFSTAQIPFLLFHFNGFICNFLHHDKEYRFATYNRSKLTILTLSNKSFHLKLKNKNNTLFLKGSLQSSKSLFAPKLGAMNTTIKEGLSGNVHVILLNAQGEKIYEGLSNQCGMELEYLSTTKS